MNAQPADRGQFTPDELLVIVETFEVALQTEGFIDTTSSGGASPVELAEILGAMGQVLRKADDLRAQMHVDGSPTRLWYVWSLDQDGYKVASPNEVWAATAADALARTDVTTVNRTDFAGWMVIPVCTYTDAADEVEPRA
jgi:hypothetical protein